MTDFPNREPNLEIRCRFQGRVAQNLQELQELGNFPSVKAAAEYVIGAFCGPVVRNLRQAQESVEQASISLEQRQKSKLLQRNEKRFPVS